MFSLKSKMYRIHNLKKKFNRLSYTGNLINTLQFFDLNKQEIYPHFNTYLMRREPTNIILHTGKLLINMKNDKNDKTKLIVEKDKTYEMEEDHDLLITENNHVISINPDIYFNFIAYEDSMFQLNFKSGNIIKYYTYHQNQKYIYSSSENIVK